jgi:hypothetical protein
MDTVDAAEAESSGRAEIVAELEPEPEPESALELTSQVGANQTDELTKMDTVDAAEAESSGRAEIVAELEPEPEPESALELTSQVGLGPESEPMLQLESRSSVQGRPGSTPATEYVAKFTKPVGVSLGLTLVSRSGSEVSESSVPVALWSVALWVLGAARVQLV